MAAGEANLQKLAERLTPAQRLELSLVGANDFEPVRGKLWFQKEMFLLCKALSEFKDKIGYDPSLMGPFSERVDWDLDQLERIGLVNEGLPGVFLSGDGREVFSVIPRLVDSKSLESASKVKALLNDLTKDELLAFVYFRYPETAVESGEVGALAPRRIELAISLVRKGKVGLEGGSRVAGLQVQDFARVLKSHAVSIHSE
jgi:predicted HTH domain antitoxin/uncharacterized protein YwgA